MAESLDVIAIVGSLRRASYTRALVEAIARIAPPSLRIEVQAIGDLPLYNPDQEDIHVATWDRFRARVKRADAVLFATPEYNRSVPGCLKNAIDVGSRPHGQSVWSGKPAAVLSTSPGAIGGFGANHHLRQSLVFLDMPTLPQPEAYVGGADRLLDASGQFVHPATREFCVAFVNAFEAWARRVGQ